jgi:hypothetical protein
MMDAQAVNTLGGICQLAGLGLVVRDLVQVVEYRGHLRRLKRRQQQIRRAINSAMRSGLNGGTASTPSRRRASVPGKSWSERGTVSTQPSRAPAMTCAGWSGRRREMCGCGGTASSC